MLTPGIKGHAALRVTTENTALAMGSGELPVLATTRRGGPDRKGLLAVRCGRAGA